MRMTICSLFLLFIFLSLTTYTIGQKKIAFGIIGGYNKSSISGKLNNLPLSFSNDGYTGQITSMNFKSRSGVSGGFFAEMPLKKQNFIHTELLYMMMGGKFVMNMEVNQADNVFPVPINGQLNFGYLALPIMYKYKLEDREGGWGFYGGIQPAYIVTNSVSIEGSRVGNVSVTDKKIDVQGVAGVDFYLSDGWGATCRYQIGILTRNERFGPISTQNIRNNALSISLAYKFHKSKKKSVKQINKN